MMRVAPVSETALIVYLGHRIDPQVTEQVGRLARFVKTDFPDALIEVIPSYTSLFIQFHPRKTSYVALEQAMLQYQSVLAQPASEHGSQSGKLITLPVYYHPDTGPDLAAVAQACGKSVEEVVTLHSQPSYTVCAIGFAPGFAFLASVDPAIAMPRHAEPRLKVPAGSVGIANAQTAVYPADSPGGWQIIGNCPQPLFSPNREPMTPFVVGDKVKFEPIDRDRFLALGGTLWPH
ncbi:5-oxoprolinase subunit PxpB [Photobacterium atrarenae]|uniref:5-oxoprolinase subunit PxpB n=1 Tax=Photobacterium atrarenae TaxID=865757 RepID=A0ABY5GBZ4_9GAMM|nr:5-oxoprolinase subunit PxpB [Photobacterium atrarenae]UTV26687.1 5-oxoprolinase subunit PxpB [Photobacterium atrarenae]